MPREAMNAQQVALYLKMTVGEVHRLACRGDLPARKVAGQFRFCKADVDHWVESRMRGLSGDRLAEIEHGVSAHHGLDDASPLVMPLIPSGGVVVPLAARTRDGAIRALVEAADAAGLVYDRNHLADHVRSREDLCPTTLGPGIALPHPRHPLPYDIAASFVIVGRTDSGIPFGCPDGTLTRLFFLICCKDDRTHLHVLARISRMLDDRTVEALLAAKDADAARCVLRRREAHLLEQT